MCPVLIVMLHSGLSERTRKVTRVCLRVGASACRRIWHWSGVGLGHLPFSTAQSSILTFSSLEPARLTSGWSLVMSQTVRSCTSTCVYICTRTYMHIYMYICIHVCMYVCVYIYVYIYMDIYNYLYIYIYTHTQ